MNYSIAEVKKRRLVNKESRSKMESNEDVDTQKLNVGGTRERGRDIDAGLWSSTWFD